ncbi:alcohol dehydrogenase catalytic domain-containing protein [Streptomyces phaeochromogenes]|uniref:alcohol dehydrogenase catalytic domain-containing protein n=1 Tax=Streptomyces phaeochromogenes TaxID=1923 RepID=UPI00368CF6D5
MMRALRWYGPGDVRVEECDKPVVLDPGDAIVKVTTAAVCGSDLHLFHGRVPKVRPGTVVGHEFCGVVESVGNGVRRVAPGTRCLSSMLTACGQCPACLKGDHLSCEHYAVFGYGEMFGGLDGAQAEYVRVPMADVTLSPVPDHLDDEDVLFVGDILATAYTGCVAARIEHGDTVAVVGAGPVGQLAAECAPLFGAGQVFSIDLVPERLREAAEIGAIPIDAREGDPARQLSALNGGRRADVVIEAVGNAAALETAWQLAATGGRLSLVGFLSEEPFPQSAGRTWMRGLDVATVVGQPIRHRHALTRLIEARRLRPRRLISDRVGLDEVPEAYVRMDRREVTKVIVKL